VRLRVIHTDWAADGPTLLAIRHRVFVDEQAVPPELEHDAHDATAGHLLALVDDTPVGTARMLPGGHIGRMAVLAEWRGQGIGTTLLRSLLELAESQGIRSPYLHAQCSAIGFYERLGFRAEGPEFLDAGIAHRLMRIPEAPASG
jgi:predicted GNAT family N-acyltransferase